MKRSVGDEVSPITVLIHSCARSQYVFTPISILVFCSLLSFNIFFGFYNTKSVKLLDFPRSGYSIYRNIL